MIKKILVISIMFFISALPSFAQDNASEGLTGGLTKFISWITNIDKVLLGIDKKENLNALERNLGYTSLYIDQIATGKLLLAKEISDLKTDKDDNKHVPSLNQRIDQLVASINNLDDYLKQIKSLLSQADQPAIDSIVLQIEQGFMYRKLYYLKDIKEALYKKDIPYEKIMKEAEESKKIADNGLTAIKVAKEKILAVLTK
jgi:hypothetical protein